MSIPSPDPAKYPSVFISCWANHPRSWSQTPPTPVKRPSRPQPLPAAKSLSNRLSKRRARPTKENALQAGSSADSVLGEFAGGVSESGDYSSVSHSRTNAGTITRSF